MNQMSKRLEEALNAASKLRPDQQDFVAFELMERNRALTQSPTKLSAQERAELEADLAAAKRGEFATDEEVAAMFRKFGL
jgi:predicted transcriptional regulator